MERHDSPSFFDRHSRTWLLLVVALSFLTYVHNFQRPQAFFWDENYHIASAQKYMNGVFFMEPHPPLGKLLIALGEVIIDANPVDDQFITTDYATNPPKEFVFAGYRLFPVLFAWLTAPLLFFIFLILTRRPLWATMLSFPYIFDTALIVHSRGAMLDSIMLFFAASTVLAFLMLKEYVGNRRAFTWSSILFGASFGFLLATKVFGLLLILLIPAALAMLWPKVRLFARFAIAAFLAFCVAYLGVWMVHFRLAQTIEPKLPDDGYYQASPKAVEFIDAGRSGSLSAFPVMLSDAQKFVSHYERGVPRLDLCKADENGSPAFLWPFGGRAISYRWETSNGYAYRYLYLVPNPVVWAAGLAGVALAATMLLAPLLTGTPYPRRRFLMLVFLGLYVAYMLAVFRIDRVMYLYHYFIPLFLTFILWGLCLLEIPQLGKWRLTEERRSMLLLGFGGAVFLGYLFYRPFAYYEPMTDEAVERRALLPTWDIRCVNCPQDGYFAIPVNKDE